MLILRRPLLRYFPVAPVVVDPGVACHICKTTAACLSLWIGTGGAGWLSDSDRKRFAVNEKVHHLSKLVSARSFGQRREYRPPVG